MAFRWDSDARSYMDEDSDEILSLEDMIDMRDEFSLLMGQEASRLATQLINDDISLSEFISSLMSLSADTFTAQYLFAVGGESNMTDDDWDALESLILAQYGFIQGFADKIVDGDKTPSQIVANAALFMHSSVQSFEVGRSINVFDVQLPAHPGDGSSECRANDKCFWRLEIDGDIVFATWVRTVAESCPTCISRAAEWAPLTFNVS